ncbi:UDP-4-amino-4,6-dideoxy-N-acetyl-beta-L-altrosamine transaminase [Synechococcus sp. HB1133]|uniref:UDP-4-amino-4, 6-dideoxy-N-acetyl-beta-L-altrosamine transaminase n=1 Tax=unclassified Synechococcus TaxID=2626047 RepID=UPI00140DDE08|nr:MULTISPECIES: UDP-4-amino-4,6-dideoxy-N-acetyl-beta-L-altrosamine transaminase [unclassified Synechococcus]MCB4421481.1 UDP-4-amino-4,6-dideoxy-N-acetyl-beta-L-altrosamine transaminase [Synechococcus sp. HB1133]MCB4431167.1 UDP-4-amino-4,6-dideoxy-N-acetyl-beta-L-altrosamine transaminase [Synechococcus sp. HBA1120]NHI80424.1 UDP-4-amino-4,6-dideoxy-N-acetyl-beta-L-altrosamine transaminase [Synechococcus sp. HB1133]
MNRLQPFIPYGRQTITEEDVAAVVNVLRSPYLTQGPVIPAFEKAIASRVGAGYGVAVNSATSALHIACLALGLSPGDRLWTSPITFVASANCARYCGAEVDFVDIDPDTGLLSLVALKAKLEQAERDGTLPKIVVPVHLCGTSCPMEQIAALANRYGFYLLEDASHAIGGHYQFGPVGNCRYSDITVFSFHPVKIITTGEGGVATTNNSHLAQRMAELRSHGITKDIHRFEIPCPGPWSYEQQDLGFNYRMTDLQAALGLSQLQRLETVVSERNRQFQLYTKLLRELPVRLLTIPNGVLSSLHLAVIRLSNPSPEHHLRVFEGLRAACIGVQLHYIPVHLHPYYRRLGFQEGDLPEAEAYSTNAISLPLFPTLKVEDQNRVVQVLSSLLSK